VEGGELPVLAWVNSAVTLDPLGPLLWPSVSVVWFEVVDVVWLEVVWVVCFEVPISTEPRTEPSFRTTQLPPRPAMGPISVTTTLQRRVGIHGRESVDRA
jgi:hypothetical protein